MTSRALLNYLGGIRDLSKSKFGKLKPNRNCVAITAIFDDYGSRYGELTAVMKRWVQEGKIKFLEDIIDGLEHAPTAFVGLFSGKNLGKLVVRVGEDDQGNCTTTVLDETK